MAIFYEIGDGTYHEPVPVGKHLEIRHTCHRTVVIHNLADDTGWFQPCKPGQIDRPFRLAGSHEYTAASAPEREHVARPNKIVGFGVRPDGCEYGCRAVGRGNARGDTVPGFDRNSECRPELRCVVGHHRPEVELLASCRCQRQTYQPTTVRRHKVHGFRRDPLGGHHQIAFVLAILVVDQNDHPTAANIFKYFRYTVHEGLFISLILTFTP